MKGGDRISYDTGSSRAEHCVQRNRTKLRSAQCNCTKLRRVRVHFCSESECMFRLRHPSSDKIIKLWPYPSCIVTIPKVRYWRQQKSDQVMLAYLRFVHLVPVGKIASLGLRRRRIAETPLQLLCDAIKVR